MIISSTNNLTDLAQYTFLTNLESAGTNTLRWRSPNGFNASWAIQVGDTGEQQSEIVLLGTATPAGTAGTLTANTLYEHPADTPLYATKYDQIVFERSITGTTGVATPISNGTVNIQPNQSFTQFDDTTGSASYGYRTYYKNSVLSSTSTESDWITSSGFSFYSLAKIRQRVKNKLVSANYITDDSIINDWINEWLEVMTNTAIKVNEDYNMGTASLAITTGFGTITQTDFKQLRRVWWVDNSGTYTATKMDSNGFNPSTAFSERKPYFYMQGDNVIGIQPSTLSGSINYEYYKLNPVLVNDTDEVPQSMKGYTKSFVNYAQAQAYKKDSKKEDSDTEEALAMGGLQQFTLELTPRNKTGPTYIDIVEAVGAETDIW